MGFEKRDAMLARRGRRQAFATTCVACGHGSKRYERGRAHQGGHSGGRLRSAMWS